MPVPTINSKSTIDDVLDWLVHPGFCQRAVTLTNDTAAKAVGDSLMGVLAYSTNGTSWKILVAADNLAAVGAKLAILIPDKKLKAAFAAGVAMGKYMAITHGSARVHKAGIVIPAGVTAATVYTMLEAQNIQVLEDTGLAYVPVGAQ